MDFTTHDRSVRVAPQASTVELHSAPAAEQLNNAHPLEARLATWDENQLRMRDELLRRAYGLGEPVRRGMELAIVSAQPPLPALALGAPSNIHRDILLNNEATITWEDVYSS